MHSEQLFVTRTCQSYSLLKKIVINFTLKKSVQIRFYYNFPDQVQDHER